jgi:hypothetical protein
VPYWEDFDVCNGYDLIHQQTALDSSDNHPPTCQVKRHRAHWSVPEEEQPCFRILFDVDAVSPAVATSECRYFESYLSRLSETALEAEGTILNDKPPEKLMVLSEDIPHGQKKASALIKVPEFYWRRVNDCAVESVVSIPPRDRKPAKDCVRAQLTRLLNGRLVVLVCQAQNGEPSLTILCGDPI